MHHKKQKHILEKFFGESSEWREGYRSFSHLLGNPPAWLLLTGEAVVDPVKTLNPGHRCRDFLLQSLNAPHSDRVHEKTCPDGYSFTFFPLSFIGQFKGYLVLCNVARNLQQKKQMLGAFQAFLSNMVHLAYKDNELKHVYETVHPRALALSTLHSLHRVMRTSLRSDELLPRIARLSAQILKARGCAIMLVEIGRASCRERV